VLKRTTTKTKTQLKIHNAQKQQTIKLQSQLLQKLHQQYNHFIQRHLLALLLVNKFKTRCSIYCTYIIISCRNRRNLACYLLGNTTRYSSMSFKSLTLNVT